LRHPPLTPGVRVRAGGQNRHMWFFLSRRIRAFLVTLALGLAAPRVARILRGYGERRRRAGGGAMTTTVPLTTADMLDKVAVWLRPPKESRRR
jgi:hypothetical protein